jgi:para-nitrobenzyl esterase
MLSRMGPAERAAYASDASSDEKLAHAVFTDSVMGAPARWIAAKTSGGAPSWLYHFSYVPTQLRGTVEGARHGSEIVFAFDTLDAFAARFGAAPSSEDKATATLMHSCWVSFAKTGTPRCGGWGAYTPASDSLMEFDAQSGVKSGFRKAQYDALEARLLPSLSVASR